MADEHDLSEKVNRLETTIALHDQSLRHGQGAFDDIRDSIVEIKNSIGDMARGHTHLFETVERHMEVVIRTWPVSEDAEIHAFPHYFRDRRVGKQREVVSR